MERTVRYEVLENEEEAAGQPVAVAVLQTPDPPPYEAGAEPLIHSGAQPAKLPNYVEATTLPTYEEAERSKLEDAARQSITENSSTLESGSTHSTVSDVNIGTDGTFVCTFLVTFIFNWLGFLISVCLSNSIAGQCGAMSGLGLSIIQWVAIVKQVGQAEWANSHFMNGDSWLWWLLFFCGVLLFIRGAVQYVRVKNEWAQLNGHVRIYRLF